MRPAITVSLVPEAKGGPLVFWNGVADACEQAAKLGFDAVEIFPSSVADVNVATVRPLLEQHARRVAAVGTGAGWVAHKLTLTHADAAIRAQAREFVRGIIDAAAALGAPAIIGSLQGRAENGVTRDQALAWLAEALRDLGNHAAQRGATLLCEPLNRYETNLLNRVPETAGWLKAVGASNVRILADLFHMNIEEVDSAAALREAREWIGHVHLADSNRRAVGFGQTRMDPIVVALREIGYQGYLSAEIVPLPDSGAAARQTITAFRQLLGR